MFQEMQYMRMDVPFSKTTDTCMCMRTGAWWMHTMQSYNRIHAYRCMLACLLRTGRSAATALLTALSMCMHGHVSMPMHAEPMQNPCMHVAHVPCTHAT